MRVMLVKQDTGCPIENSALATTYANDSRVIANQRRMDDIPRVWCDYYKKSHHTRENCWKIHGKLANWNSNKPNDRPNRWYPSANEAKMSYFSKEQMD